jgi:hypothetical protein
MATSGDSPWCPSADPAHPEALAFGVRTNVDGVRVGYLAHPVKVTRELLALAVPVEPTEVFRFGAPCVESKCAHFSDERCGLATTIVEEVPVAVSGMPACSLRKNCRWFSQEGAAACLRCPVVMTRESGRNETVAHAALPRILREPTADDT